MDKKEFVSKIAMSFNKNGLGKLLSQERSEAFFALTERMLAENEKYNLTAITDVDMIILNHYVDCAALAARLPKGVKIIDVGCGAGFPTLPLSILRPDLKITAVDSTAKRINYVNQTATLLGLTNIEAVTLRAEDGGRDPLFREKFDIATARAVANMRVLCELCLPFVKVGGQMMAMKGKNAEFELSESKRAIATLGGRGTRVESIVLKSNSDEDFSHPLIIIEKKEKTPSLYPRPFAQISKKPL